MNNVLIQFRSSMIIKGLAICLMLIHHLYFHPTSAHLFNDFHIYYGSHNIGVVNYIGIYGKLCVALFVFLSGYGLEVVNMSKVLDVKNFYRKRFTKLYMNYWFVWLIFVPIGILAFGRTFSDAYGSHVLLKGFLDFFGVINLMRWYGYNATWWFYSCIIVLYLLYPFLHRYIINRWLLVLGGIACIPLPIPFITPISHYLLPFIVGMYVARIPTTAFDTIQVWDIIVAFVLLSVVRNLSSSLVCMIDTMLCVTIATFFYKVKLAKWLSTILQHLGKHSQNIFLFHTFIFAYWFEDFIYMSRNPIIIFLTLLLTCYLISVVLEYIKKITRFYSLVDRIAIPSLKS